MQKSNEDELNKLLKKHRKKNLEMKFLNDKNQKEGLNSIKIRNRRRQHMGYDRKVESAKFLNFNLENFDKDISKQIFEELDKGKTGKIKVDDFLDYLNEKLETHTNFHPFYLMIMEELSGKSEKIILKLKKLKHKLQNDTEALDDLNW